MRKKPNLIIPGFPKSGTSSLFACLRMHPSIFGSSKVKEPHNYSFDQRYKDRFRVEYKHSYRNLFADSTNEIYFMDASTTYLISNRSPQRMSADNPDSKIVVLARDPIERVFSHYNWLRSLGIATQGFEEEISEWLGRPFVPETRFNGNF